MIFRTKATVNKVYFNVELIVNQVVLYLILKYVLIIPCEPI